MANSHNSTESPARGVRIQRARLYLAQRTHQGSPGLRCQCGPCAHQVLVAAMRFRVAMIDLRTTPGIASPQSPPTAPMQRTRAALASSVGAVATVSVGSRQLSAMEGLTLLVNKTTRAG